VTEPPLYRPFALLAFAATVLAGAPIGARVLLAYHAGAPAVAVPWLLLHAHVQIIAFFGTLILGVAPHLLARFTGRPLRAPSRPWLAPLALAAALVLRAAGTAIDSGGALAFAAGVQALVFAAFVARVWAVLDPPPLARVRAQLTLASAWLAVALLAETALHTEAWARGAAASSSLLRGLHAGALLGGVLGWVLGVLLRAGPMFVPEWTPPPWLARALPALLGIAALLAVAGEAALVPASALAARLGEGLAIATATGVVVGGGALRRAGSTLPLLSRGAAEARIFRVAAVSAVAALAGAAATVVGELTGIALPLVADAVRHLLTVGVLGAVAIAMGVRLVIVLEGAPLPWPRLRTVALVALGAGVVTRTAQIVIPAGITSLAPVVVLSGLLAWLAFACVGVTLVGVVLRRPAD
jgi:hypothetical protein